MRYGVPRRAAGTRADRFCEGGDRLQRGNSKHSSCEDDELKRDVEGTVHGNRSSRSEEWRDPEPPADDDPDVRTAGPTRRES
ncbi:hypothetical protein [Mycobacterium sp. 852002-10029_SCH5224772]|uniref:hypothetical protein n=1 Tax=Mycobacterium sp. 852002-10029_SCH5224772 TaxID=1834083 RepID=UPI0007FC1B2D|nr:hypothetical protein [Mycobacterium sp. 852002-10029_SCH5224772]OBE98601.1 hypothetical protein A5775_07790 [Mycobacterium sp. 852002-10029_SCH5224772]